MKHRGFTFMAESIQTPNLKAESQTNSNIIGTLRLDGIQKVVNVADGKAMQLMETCIWCLDYCQHPNGVPLKIVDVDGKCFYRVTWPKDSIDLETIRRTYNKDDATEDGAEALAFLICVERTDYTIVERASTKTGIDYWLGFKDKSPNQPFYKAGRLEISGIMAENKNNKVTTRVQSKLLQTAPTDYSSFPVYVIVVEFSEPHASMVLKNVTR